MILRQGGPGYHYNNLFGDQMVPSNAELTVVGPTIEDDNGEKWIQVSEYREGSDVLDLRGQEVYVPADGLEQFDQP